MRETLNALLCMVSLSLIASVLSPVPATAGPAIDPVQDPVSAPGQPFPEPSTFYRVRVARFVLTADFKVRPGVVCEVCPDSGRVEVRLGRAGGEGRLFYFHRRPSKGGGSFGINHGTRTIRDQIDSDGSHCKETVPSGHSVESFGAILRPGRRVRVGMSAQPLGYFSGSRTCHGGPGDSELGVLGAFPDRTFPRRTFARRHFALRFIHRRHAQTQEFDVTLRQDVILKLRRIRRETV